LVKGQPALSDSGCAGCLFLLCKSAKVEIWEIYCKWSKVCYNEAKIIKKEKRIMRARRFDLFHLTIKDIMTFRAYQRDHKDGKDKVCFTYSDTMKFTTVRKRNTQLFDVLYEVYKKNGLAYESSERVIQDYLYDAIIVEMRTEKNNQTAVCLTGDKTAVRTKKAKDLPAFLYRNGFTIKGIPLEKCSHGKKAANGETIDLKYVPFIASASMARQSEYLFVRDDAAPELMRRLSLDILDMDKGLPFASGVVKKVKEKDADEITGNEQNDDLGILRGTKADGSTYRFLSPSKISAYIGNSLSDGSSVSEMQSAWESIHKDGTPVPEVKLDENTVICVEDCKNFPMHTEDASFYVWKMQEFDQSRPELTGNFCPTRKTDAGDQDTGLIQLFVLLSSAKKVAKTIKEQIINEDVKSEWKEQIEQINLSDLEEWMAEAPIPLCMPASKQQIWLRMKQMAFLIALRLETLERLSAQKEPWKSATVFDFSETKEELDKLKETLKTKIESLFDTKNDYDRFKSLLKWIHLPDKDNAVFTTWKISKVKNDIRFEFQISRNHILLEPFRKGNEEINVQDTPLGRFCGMVALFAAPMKNKEDFDKYLKDHGSDVMKAWIHALGEIEQPPMNLEKKRLPYSANLLDIAKSVHGYAFLYAAVMHLKQKCADVNDQRTLYFKIDWDSKAETASDNMDKAEKGSESMPYTFQELCRILSKAVEEMLKGSEKNTIQEKWAAGLWNSVRGAEDSGTRPELISCGAVNKDEDDGENNSARKLLRISLMNNSFTPFRAELTPSMPVELNELFQYLVEKDKEDKEKVRSLIEDCEPALKRQMELWLKWKGKPQSMGDAIHTCCETLERLGVCPTEEKSAWNAETIWDKTRNLKENFGDYTKVYRKKKDELFENAGNFYDGVGFADDEVFDALERLMTGKQEIDRRYNGFIIRLPWVKGLLVRLNWQKILLEKAGLEDADNQKITDVFGKKRPLKGAHVLLTESMFKGYKQLKQLNPENEEVKKLFKTSEEVDPWVYFWKKINEYKISLLIAGRNSLPSPTTRMNYQFLATNVLSADEIKKLVEGVLEKTVLRYENPAKFIKLYGKKQEKSTAAVMQDEEDADIVFRPIAQIDDGVNTDEGPIEGADGKENLVSADDDQLMMDDQGGVSDQLESEYESINENEIQEKLSELLPDFKLTNYMKKAMDSRVRSVVLEMMRGQIPEIRGDVRFLVPDLDAMLEWISQLVEGSAEGRKKRVRSPINECGERGMGHYYAPAPDAHKRTWYDVNKSGEIIKGRDAVILRNPHLAAGEDALLMPLEGSQLLDYEKNYGHLNGVVMIPSTCFSTINGADSDGDRASVVTQDEIVDAVSKSVEMTNDVIKKAIENKKSLIAYLKKEEEKLKYQKEEADSKGGKSPGYDPNLPEYIESLRWLIESLPESLPELLTNSENSAKSCRLHVCPPLIYSGSNAKGNLLSPVELPKGSKTLKKAFWKAYTLTTEQAIGVMSLNALDNATAAYRLLLSDETLEKLGLKAEKKGAGPSVKSEQKDDVLDESECMLNMLRFWRVVNGALQTALEIDMAKTGVRPYTHSLQENLKKRDALFFGEIHASRSSVFRTYRNVFVERRAKLVKMDEASFSSTMEQILGNIYAKWDAKECHPVELIPKIVWTCWLEKQKRLPYSSKSKSFGALFNWKALKKEWNDRKKAKKAEVVAEVIGNEEEMMMIWQKSIEQYGRTIDARKKLASRRRMLESSYLSCIRYLLREYPMIDAMRKMEELLPNQGENALRAIMGKNYNLEKLSSCDNKLREESVLAAFVWEESAAEREKCYRTQLNIELNDIMLSSIVKRHAFDIYFMKQLIKYLREEEEIIAGCTAKMNGVHTPAALRMKLLSEAKGVAESEIKKLLLIKCFELLNRSGGYIVDESGARIKVMSEFLMIHLLGDYLVEIASKNESKKEE